MLKLSSHCMLLSSVLFLFVPLISYVKMGFSSMLICQKSNICLMPTVRIRSWLQPENKMTALVPDSLAVSRDISVQISSVALVVWIKPATISS